MNKILKISFCLLSVCLILVSMIPTAFAVDIDIEDYYLDIQKPSIDENSGYVELLFEDSHGLRWVVVVVYNILPSFILSNPDGNGYDFHVFRDFVFYKQGFTYDFYPSMTLAAGDASVMIVDSSGVQYHNYHNFTFDSHATASVDFGKTVSLKGYHINGHYDGISGDVINGGENFFVVYSDDAVISSNLVKILNSINNLSDSLGGDYSDILNSILSSLNSFSGSFDEFEEFYKTKLSEILSLFNQVLDKLDSILVNTQNLDSYVSNIVLWLWDMEWIFKDQYYQIIESNVYLSHIEQKIDKLIELLESKGESDLTQPDTSNLDGYYDVEHSLLDDSNVDPSQVLNIELNQNALSAIWNLVDRVLNVNPKVFGAVIIILALGILALILGR